MSNYGHNDDKTKNGHNSAKPERGGGLTLYLGFLAFGNFLLLIWLVNLWIALQNRVIYSSPYAIIPARTNPMNYVLIGFLILSSFLLLACIYGLWNLKNWGYYGLMMLYGLGIVLGVIMYFINGNGSSVIGSVVGMVILHMLVRDKLPYLE